MTFRQGMGPNVLGRPSVVGSEGGVNSADRWPVCREEPLRGPLGPGPLVAGRACCLCPA